jgi:hypothetical protein
MKLGALVRTLHLLGTSVPRPIAEDVSFTIEHVFSILRTIDDDLIDWHMWYYIALGDESEFEDWDGQATQTKKALCTIKLGAIENIREEVVKKNKDGGPICGLKLPVPEMLVSKLRCQYEK